MPFADLFQNYLNAARAAQANKQHHDYRRTIFLDFLQKAFDIDAPTIDVEKYVKIDVGKKGWIDALFRNVVFEFKRDLTRERPEGLRELRDYLKTVPYGAECVALLTDGLIFETYTLDVLREDDPRPIDAVDLGKMEATAAFLWLDAYLFSQVNVPPTSADLVQRFGVRSPAFQAAARTLAALLERLSETPAVTVKRQQWRAVLAKVYGSDIGSDDLFVRHTFLNQFAKLLAYSSLDGIPRDENTLVQIISGEAFHPHGVSNLGEIDFFAWILDDPQARAEAVMLLRSLAQSLVVYDLKQINEDLLKQLYQNLVDPATRHELGEYYTPDWLAELTLQEIDYQPGQSLLDPSCGSGTFLFTAIRRLAAQGLTGWKLVDFALENIAGMDVHPLAVTVARINYLLAITPHMRGPRSRALTGLVPLPVYMADALKTPEAKGHHKDTLIVPVDSERDENFRIPDDAARAPAVFTEVIDLMDEYARYPMERVNLELAQSFDRTVRERFSAAKRGIADLSSTYWLHNLRLLNRLIHEGRNSIWAYMLKNTARPLLLAAQKFDVIVGNPPWLSYRYIRDKTYQKEVKDLTLHYGLLESGEVKLFTQMDLSTLFMVHCETTYLREGGTIAFVMPRSVITGAKQHRRFQARGMSRVLDLRYVEPLFNTEACVVMRKSGDLHIDNVPATGFRGQLPTHQMPLSEAKSHLRTDMGSVRLIGEVKVSASYYYERFKQGATLVPRNLCFVRPRQQIKPGDAAVNPSMETDPDVNTEAKAPWKDVRLEGQVYGPNLYATLLSKNLMPFGYRRLHLVALPVRVDSDGKLKIMAEHDFLESGHIRSWKTWFEPAENKWNALKKDTTGESLIEWLNYQSKLTNQTPSGVYKVLYNAGGTHISACVLDTRGTPQAVYEYPTQGFIVDNTNYYLETGDFQEAHYLCALLNAPVTDNAIKAYQTRGMFGERHIHRTPFETCAILPFDPANPDHIELARLSQQAHAVIAKTQFTGSVSKARDIARAAVRAEIQAIDVIARRVLGLPTEAAPSGAGEEGMEQD